MPRQLVLLVSWLLVVTAAGVLAQAPAPVSEPQPYFYPAPPEGFSAVTASDADLATYGFPPRPPLGSAAYTRWINLMSNAKHRVDNPVARPLGILHSPKQLITTPTGATGAPEASKNWSGVDEVYSYPFFGSQGTVDGGWQQPNIASNYENCAYGPYRTWIWVGMDGSGDAIAGNDDVLQAGTAVEACPAQSYAWYEWNTTGCSTNDNGQQPCQAYFVPQFVVRPNDYVYVVVTYNASSQYKGNAFLSNQSTGQYATVGFNQPPGIPSGQYQGYSAEWILEAPLRPPPATTPYDLANYNPFYGISPTYLHGGTYYNPGYDTSATFNVINMYCTNYTWFPGSGCPYPFGTNISVANYWSYWQQPPPGYGTGWIYLNATGPAVTQ